MQPLTYFSTCCGQYVVEVKIEVNIKQHSPHYKRERTEVPRIGSSSCATIITRCVCIFTNILLQFNTFKRFAQIALFCWNHQWCSLTLSCVQFTTVYRYRCILAHLYILSPVAYYQQLNTCSMAIHVTFLFVYCYS
jgi:hypothetical protein